MSCLYCFQWFMRDKTEQEEYIPNSGMPKFHHVPVEQLFQIPKDRKDSTTRPHIPHRHTSTPVITALKKLEYPQEEEYDVISDSEDSDVGILTPQPVQRFPILVEVGEKSVPFLQFSLCYDIQRRILTVHLQNASNLPAKDRSGTSDPFVVLHLLPNKDEIYESKIIYKTLDPIFDQSFEFHQLQLDDLQQQKLVFSIYDHDRFSANDFIGGIILPLSEDVDMFGAVYRMNIDERVENFKPTDSKGYLFLSLTYLPSNSTIQGVLLKATSLQKQDITGTADPYVKVYVVHNGKKHSEWKSTIKMKTLIPTFNEPFQFDILNLNIKDISLQFVVMDYDRFSRDDIVGYVQVGPSAREDMGRTHWEELISKPTQPISKWHTISSVLCT